MAATVLEAMAAKKKRGREKHRKAGQLAACNCCFEGSFAHLDACNDNEGDAYKAGGRPMNVRIDKRIERIV